MINTEQSKRHKIDKMDLAVRHAAMLLLLRRQLKVRYVLRIRDVCESRVIEYS